MELSIESELKPLIANLRRLDFKYFLGTGEFENTMLENNFDGIWSAAVHNHHAVGNIAGPRAREEAFIEMCNYLWKKDMGIFLKMIKYILISFVKKNKKIDIDPVLTVLENLGLDPSEVEELRILTVNKTGNGLSDSKNLTHSKKGDLVFIGHGRSPLWREVDVFLREENISFEDFESDSRTGEHVIDVLKGFLAKATFAIIVVTAEDKADNGKVRARQNVIHEIGLFQGKLGFENVAILKQNGVEGFSNNDGLQHIPFDGNDIKHTFYELGRTLKKAGLRK